MLRHDTSGGSIESPVMEIACRFLQALTATSRRPGGDSSLLPVQLAGAATVLPIDGAGLAVYGPPNLWTPLAASNETAALVEHLQFTIGEGPCQRAAERGSPVIATADLLAQQWPVLYDLLLSHTPIRSILVMPLTGRVQGLGFVSFCSTAPTGVTMIPMIEICTVTGLISEHLGSATDWSPWPPTIPKEVNTLAARRRGQVWTAVGMLVATLELSDTAALTLLRSYAYAHDHTVDDLAADLVEGRISLNQLGGDTGSDR